MEKRVRDGKGEGGRGRSTVSFPQKKFDAGRYRRPRTFNFALHRVLPAVFSLFFYSVTLHCAVPIGISFIVNVALRRAKFFVLSDLALVPASPRGQLRRI